MKNSAKKFAVPPVWIFALIGVCGVLLVFGGREVLKNKSAQDVLKTTNTEGSIQIVMNELCEKEVAEFCPNTWGMETYNCIKRIDPKFLSERCLSTFK